MTEPNDALVLGIDLGGTKILTAVVNSRGHLISRDRCVTPAESGPDTVIRAIMESAHRCLDQAKIARDRLSAIGIGAPGPSNPATGILFSSPNLPGWKDVPLTEILTQKLGKPAFLINDGNAAALAEYRYGAGQNARCFIYITLSTGIGGGIVIDGKVFTGAAGTAGEIGHMTIDPSGPKCNCGNIGCWEALASGTALAREARSRISNGEDTTLLTYVKGDMERITAEAIQKAADAGDVLANELVMRTSEYLGIGFANLINLFNPDIIAIGGGLANMGDRLLTPAYRIAGERAFPSTYKTVRFVPAALRRDSGVLGAAAHAVQSRFAGTKEKPKTS